MIFSKNKENQGVKTIAVQAAERGLGTTHISICTANALAMAGKRVALIEWNGHGDFAEIEKCFHGFGFTGGNEKMFRIRRVDYFKSYREKGLAGIKKENYDFIVADIGYPINSYFAEAEYPVLVVSGSEWRAGKQLPAIRAAEETVGSRLKIWINFGNHEEMAFFQKKSGAQYYLFPFWKDAFSSTKEQRTQIGQIFL